MDRDEYDNSVYTVAAQLLYPDERNMGNVDFFAPSATPNNDVVSFEQLVAGANTNRIPLGNQALYRRNPEYTMYLSPFRSDAEPDTLFRTNPDVAGVALEDMVTGYQDGTLTRVQIQTLARKLMYDITTQYGNAGRSAEVSTNVSSTYEIAARINSLQDVADPATIVDGLYILATTANLADIDTIMRAYSNNTSLMMTPEQTVRERNIILVSPAAHRHMLQADDIYKGRVPDKPPLRGERFGTLQRTVRLAYLALLIESATNDSAMRVLQQVRPGATRRQLIADANTARTAGNNVVPRRVLVDDAVAHDLRIDLLRTLRVRPVGRLSLY